MRAGYPLKSSLVVLFSIIVANSSPVALATHASIALPPAGYRFYPSCKRARLCCVPHLLLLIFQLTNVLN